MTDEQTRRFESRKAREAFEARIADAMRAIQGATFKLEPGINSTLRSIVEAALTRESRVTERRIRRFYEGLR